MSYYKISLKAGIPFTMNTPGRLVLVDSVGVAGGVDVQIVRNGSPGANIPMRKPAFRHVGEFDGVILTAAIDSDVGIFLSFDDVQLGVADGSSVAIPNGVKVTNVAGEEIPVLFAGTVAPVVGTINNTDAQAIPVKVMQAQAVTNVAPFAVTDVAGAMLAAAVARKGMRLRNVGPEAVAIGGAGVTFANAAVIVQAGETWNENEAAPAAWYAICGAGLTSTINIQTIA